METETVTEDKTHIWFKLKRGDGGKQDELDIEFYANVLLLMAEEAKLDEKHQNKVNQKNVRLYVFY